jgi:hypothetical protein
LRYLASAPGALPRSPVTIGNLRDLQRLALLVMAFWPELGDTLRKDAARR